MRAIKLEADGKSQYKNTKHKGKAEKEKTMQAKYTYHELECMLTSETGRRQECERQIAELQEKLTHSEFCSMALAKLMSRFEEKSMSMEYSKRL